MSNSELDLATMRHSAAHVMAAAVRHLWPDAKFDIGPSTDDGFYYDFDLEHRLTAEDFPAIEAEMAKMVAEDFPFVREEKSREEVMELMKGRGQTYKLERLADIPEGETISLYHSGDFTDLCRGPHVKSSGEIKAFKVLSVAGSYFRGDERNPMLQRLWFGRYTKLPEGGIEELQEALPNTIINTTNEYGSSGDWRYEGKHLHPRYALLREQFDYSNYTNVSSSWYNDPKYYKKGERRYRPSW